jgi:hypothetical protein
MHDAADIVLVQVLRCSRVRAVCDAPDGAGLQRRGAHCMMLRSASYLIEGGFSTACRWLC